jgi:hypothetical protein
MHAVPDRLTEMLTQLKLTAVRDQLDGLLDEAGRQALSLRETLVLLCEREIARKNERRIEMTLASSAAPPVPQRGIDRGPIMTAVSFTAGEFISFPGDQRCRHRNAQLRSEVESKFKILVGQVDHEARRLIVP